MGLFQNSILRKYLKGADDKVCAAYKKYAARFHNPEIQENIRSCKEEEFQDGFLRELFVNIFGYTLKPAPNYNIVREHKNETGSKKADAAILVNGEVVGVIELKDGKTTDLKQAEAQAFGYKNYNRNASYVIISNFEKLRFYIDNAVDFIEFNLFTLNQDEFAVLWLCLDYGNIERHTPKQVKSESAQNEDQITKRLYKEYAAFKQALFTDLTAHNPGRDKLTLFKKSQKLLDRILFILFAEDCGLLPPNSIAEIIEQWKKLKELDEYKPLYDRLKKYFGYMNTGFKGKKHDVFAYNGGLFAPDEVLDSIQISDEAILPHLQSMSRYDFSSEVDVNILGHIFENSLTEIEEITSAISADAEPKTVGKRKKDGVFYTPRYITAYIVENTLGKLCADKKAELEIDETAYSSDRKRTGAAVRKLERKLIDYREWLLSLTICDPACGSGAFLNAALDFLMAEHSLIDEMRAKLHDGKYQLFGNIENDILENNLFGVDINEESVEIAKLALWLRTAKPHRKLNSLNNNIKCGNSLISDSKVAGDKAFDWAKEFPQVFEKGGFDVVIGNPPYVQLEKILDVSKQLSKLNYKTYDKRGDLYTLFVEKGFSLLRNKGYISYIMPNKWIQAGYGKLLRAFFLTKELIQLVDFGDIQIFQGATTYPCIFTACNNEPKTEFSVSVLKNDNADDFYSNVAQTAETFKTRQFSEDTWVVSSQQDSQLFRRLKKENITLEKFVNGEAYYGIKFGLTEAFLIDDTVKRKLIDDDSNSANIIGSVLRGRNLTRYGTPNVNELDHIILASFGSHTYMERDYPAVYKHIVQYEDKLRQRGQCNGSKATPEKPYTGQHHWLELDNNPSERYLAAFTKPKIMYQAFQVKPCFIFDEHGLFCNNSMWFITTDNKALLAILNSKMGWWLISKYCTQIQNGHQLIWKYFCQIPIPPKNLTELGIAVNKMLSLNSDLQTKRQRLLNRLSDNFPNIKITGVLNRFDELEFKQFVAELKKQKIALSLKQQDEWDEYFGEYRELCRVLAGQIESTDREIDLMVYELYGLSEEEIRVVEGRTSV